MAQNPHEYLIEQLQFTGDESVGSSSNKIKLNFNHPCKELVWVVQPDANVDYCASLEGGSTLYRTLGAQPFNYTDAIEALPNAIHAFGGPAETSGTDAFIKFDKGDFVGRDALLRKRDQGVASTWVGLHLTGTTPAPEQTPVMAEGRQIGHITYSDHGYTVGAVLASAHIETGFAIENTQVSVLGQPATVRRKAFFDPEGLRLRS